MQSVTENHDLTYAGTGGKDWKGAHQTYGVLMKKYSDKIQYYVNLYCSLIFCLVETRHLALIKG